jgi:pimeloyl-ACP methyl ester carboxylesterase
MSESSSQASFLRHYRQGRSTRPRGRSRSWIVAGALFAALATGSTAALVEKGNDSWRPPSGAPRFVACTYGGRLDAWCGRVTVPEDRGRRTRRSISLRVAVIPATQHPADGAFFYLEGGPGGAATDSAVGVNELFASVSRTRDLVLVDQRGTGGSHALVCPQEHVRADDSVAVAEYLRRCFRATDGDARAYTTDAAADDVEAVRRTLGYGKIDVYGGSYGATLAQVLLQRHTSSVRTAILDGASLLDVPLFELSARNAERALRIQFARCAAESRCRRAFPSPRADLANVLSRPARRVRIPYRRTVRLDRDAIAITIELLSRSPDGVAQIPLLVHEAARGNDLPLAEQYVQLVEPTLGARSRLAMYWVIQCSEPWARYDTGSTVRESRGSYLAHVALARARFFGAACRAVPRGDVGDGSSAVARSRVPVLILAGEADPQDPPGNVRGWRTLFPNGRLVVAPGLGHGVVEHGCLRLLAAAFVERGAARGLDVGCARKVPLPRFATGP